MTYPRCYGGVRLLGNGPSMRNVARLDAFAMPMTIRMMQTGLQVDLSKFAVMDIALTQDMERVTEEVKALTGYRINLSSGDQISDLLFKKLGLKQARFKLTKSEKRESTEEEVLLAIQHDHEAVPRILEYKEYDKLRGTYVRPMPRLATRTAFGVWRMFPNLGHTRVPSGRYNCKEPNLLAMPTRTKRGRDIRKAFITDTGWTFLSVDESQIEVRVCTHCSGDENLLRVYLNNEDVYSDFAISAFKLPDRRFRNNYGVWEYPGVDKLEHRYPSKTCFLAAIYDVSPPGLLEQMPVICSTCHKPTTSDNPDIALHNCGRFVPLWNEDKCADILTSLYQRYPGILKDRKLHHRRAMKSAMVWDMWGRMLHVAAVRSVHPWVVSAALREAGNLPYQGGACGTFKLTLGQVHEDFKAAKMWGDVVRPLLPIHDELLCEVREDMAEEVAEHIKYRFEGSAPLKVPIKAGSSTGNTWGSIEK